MNVFIFVWGWNGYVFVNISFQIFSEVDDIYGYFVEMGYSLLFLYKWQVIDFNDLCFKVFIEFEQLNFVWMVQWGIMFFEFNFFLKVIL